ncbi:MAG TPA: threonine-phosphate decarboxylase CobD [Blastocatellia bacterium]|nr:threonine-phosphate decarboxylase CobD [Blastocatellia bacterium]
MMNESSIELARLSRHGGRVYEAARRWGIDPDEVIDFSANINPLGAPPGVIAAIRNGLAPVALRTYPDPHAFVSAVADRHRVDPDQVLVGNGMAALIFALWRAIRPGRVLLLEPGFDEYLRACAAVKAEVFSLGLREERGFSPDFAELAEALVERRCDLVVLNSPHNPTGRLYERAELRALAEVAERHRVAVILDEAFIDYVPQSSLLRLAAAGSRFAVLRSLTKFYAMPGLRLGYGVCGAELAAAVREQIDPWPVSAIALEAGVAALSEPEYDARSILVNAQAREEFAAALRGIGLQVFPSSANFLLAKLPGGSGAELAGRLEAERILIRRGDSFRGLGDRYIRLAVRSEEDNRRLVSLINAWLELNREIRKTREI